MWPPTTPPPPPPLPPSLTSSFTDCRRHLIRSRNQSLISFGVIYQFAKTKKKRCVLSPDATPEHPPCGKKNRINFSVPAAVFIRRVIDIWLLHIDLLF